MFEGQESITLYKLDSRGKMRMYRIDKAYDEDGFYSISGLIDGKEQVKFIEVYENQSGRDIEEQIDLEVSQRLKLKMDAGYCITKEQAKERIGKDRTGNIKPMLASKYQPGMIAAFNNVYVQRKYDGHRCVIVKEGESIRAYSRTGNDIETIDHILEKLKLVNGDFILDGELYIHGHKLQQLTSLIKRKQRESEDLCYVCYDMISDLPFYQRYLRLFEIVCSVNSNKIFNSPTMKINFEHEVEKYLSKHKAQGYEGSMLRVSDKGYEPGKRSRQLIKVKKQLDCEVTVCDISRSADGWAILGCRTEEGIAFSCSAPGNISQKTEILQNREHYIGRALTIEFSHWTDEGKPFHPVALRFREDV